MSSLIRLTRRFSPFLFASRGVPSSVRGNVIFDWPTSTCYKAALAGVLSAEGLK